MEIIYHPLFLEHITGNHPESPARLRSFGSLKSTDIPVNTEWLKVIHSENYINSVIEHCKTSQPLDGDTMTSPMSYEAALKGVGAAVLASQTGNFALSRPPGHHAYAERGSGFCLFNNIAIASELLVKQGKKVFIFDFDGHYGDGTADIFYESNNVLYCSIHQHPAFPGNGDIQEMGSGKGLGYTINIPVPPHAGDDILMDATKAILPIVKKFNPDYVAISAGFDGHIDDPLLDLRYSTDGFYQLGHLLRKSFQNIFAVLEGGYNTEVLPSAVSSFLDGINGNSRKHKEYHTDSEMMVWNKYELKLDELLTSLKPLWGI